MKIVKWFFGISAVYGLVKLFRIYKRCGAEELKREQKKIHSHLKDDTPKWVRVLVSASTWVGVTLTYGMRWASDLFCVIGASINSLLLMIFDCWKPIEEGESI